MAIKLRSALNNGLFFVTVRFLLQDRFFRIFKESFWIALGQVMAVIGTLVGVRVLTELLDPDAFGELALGMTVAVLVNQTVLGPLSNGVARFYSPALAQDDLAGYLNAVHRLIFLAIGIIGFIILFSISGLLISGKENWIAMVLAAFIYSIINGCNSIFNGILNASRKRSIVALHQGMDASLRVLVAACLLLIFGAKSHVALIGYAVSGCIIFVSQNIFLNKTIVTSGRNIKNSKNWRKKIWMYSWPFATWGGFTWAQLASDRWALGVFSTNNDVGLYTALFQLGYYPMSIATGMVVQILAPIFYQKSGDGVDGDRDLFVSKMSRKVTWGALVITGSAVPMAFLFHAQIFRLFVAKEYASASHLLPWMVLASGLFAAGQVITLKLMSEMKTKDMIVAKIVTAIIGVVLNFIGAYIYGIEGVVVSGAIFSSVYFFVMANIASKNNK